jgi:REP element-mobilizing transposase RayT
MNQFSHKPFYRRRLPHIQPEGATFFITFRLAGSLPVEVIEKLRAEHEKSNRWFEEWDEFLGRASIGLRHLADERIADLLSESLRYRDGKVYDLVAFCVMPNHVHVVFKPLESITGKNNSLSVILHSLKRHTARQANLILGQADAFWQPESYDHILRDEAELERVIKYISYNPVKAGRVNAWNQSKWLYCKDEFSHIAAL